MTIWNILIGAAPPFSPNSSGETSLESSDATPRLSGAKASGVGGEAGELRKRLSQMETDLALVNQERQDLEFKLGVCEDRLSAKVNEVEIVGSVAIANQ